MSGHGVCPSRCPRVDERRTFDEGGKAELSSDRSKDEPRKAGRERVQWGDTPLIQMLKEWAPRTGERWHTPGHKGVAPSGGLRLSWAWDVTEVGPWVRDGGAEDPVRASERRLAEALCTRRSWFSVQGASLPVTAGLLAAGRPGATVALERHAHRSATAALIIGGFQPHWLVSPLSPAGLPLPADEGAWQRALDHVDVLFLTRPTYDGVGLPDGAVQRIIEQAHARGQSVVVDEAHGAHWPGRAGYPQSALYLGADLVAHGVHKTEPALTQTGALHLMGSRIPAEAVDLWWDLLVTSSPSYLLLASLDQWQAERAQAETTVRWEKLADRARDLGQEVTSQGGRVWQVMAESVLDLAADPAKFTLLGPGPEWARRLAKWGMVEKIEPGAVTWILAPHQSLDILRRALDELRPWDAGGAAEEEPEASRLPPMVLLPREAACHPVQWVPLGQAVGRIAGRAVVPYPPGSPWVVPGEQITEDLVTAICRRTGRNWEGTRQIDGELYLGVVAGFPQSAIDLSAKTGGI